MLTGTAIGAGLTVVTLIVSLAHPGAANLPEVAPAEVAWDIITHGLDDYSISDDASLLFTESAYRTIHVGRLMVWSWPYWGGLAAAVLLLLVVLRSWRIARSPEERGARYCRRCRYLLRGVTGAACPECGVSLTPRTVTRGQSNPVRLVRAARVPLSLIVVYLAALAAGAPRSGWVGDMIPFTSRPLYDWLDKRYPWLDHRIQMARNTFVQRKPNDLSRNRVIFDSDREITHALADDRLYITDGRRMVVWDVDAQRVLSNLRAPRVLWPRRNQTTPSPYVIPLKPAPAVLFYHPRLLWDFTAGEVRQIDETERSKLYTMHAERQRHSDGRWLVAFENGHGGDSEIRVRRHLDAAPRIIHSDQFGNVFHSHDGSTIYVCGNVVVGYDATTGTEVLRLRPPRNTDDFASKMAVSRDDRWLFIFSFNDSKRSDMAEVLMYDLIRKRWVARLLLPSLNSPRAMWVHPDQPMLVIAGHTRNNRHRNPHVGPPPWHIPEYGQLVIIRHAFDDMVEP